MLSYFPSLCLYFSSRDYIFLVTKTTVW